MKTQNSQHVALLYTRIQLQTVKHLTSNLIRCRFYLSFQISVSYYKITRLSEAGVSTTKNGLYIRQHLVDPFEIMLKWKPIRCWTENTSQLLRTNSRPQNVFPSFITSKWEILTVGLLVAGASSRSTKLLGLAAAGISNQKGPVVLNQDIFDLFLGRLIHIWDKRKIWQRLKLLTCMFLTMTTMIHTYISDNRQPGI